MNNREWLNQMEQRRRGESRERLLLTLGVVALVLVGGYFIASAIHDAFTGVAQQLEAAGRR